MFRYYSPSDLEADLEDNQDYDSTVSQSETNLTMIGSLPPIAGSAPSSQLHPLSELAKQKPSLLPTTMATSLEYDDADSMKDDTNSSDAVATRSQRPVSYPMRFTDKVDTNEAPLKSSLSSRIQKKEAGSGEGEEGVAQREHVRWRDRNVVNEVAILEEKQELEKVSSMKNMYF